MRLAGDVGKVYKELSELLPKEAIQKADKAETKKGYSTTGYGYQYIVNRFNEVCHIDGWGYDYKIIEASSGTFQSGKPYIDITVEVTINIYLADMDKVVTISRKCIGGHISSTYGDALKGALTNGIKKTAGLFGVGNQAYLGILDDDATYEDEIGSTVVPALPPKSIPQPQQVNVVPEKPKKLSDESKGLFNVLVGIAGKNKQKVTELLQYVTGKTSLYDIPDSDIPAIIAQVNKTFRECPKGTKPCDYSEWDNLGVIWCKKIGKKCLFPEGEKAVEAI